MLNTLTSPVSPGVYKIISTASRASIRCYQPSTQVYSSSTREFPGPFELWNLTPGRDANSMYIQNIGLNMYATSSGSQIVTGPVQTSYTISSNGDNTYTISTDDQNMWTVQPPVIPRGNVSLQPGNGQEVQSFRLIRNDY